MPHTRSMSTYSQHHEDENGSKYGNGSGNGNGSGELDSETEREYKKRYAREKRVERRPTLGGSLLSMVDAVGKAFGGGRH